MDQLGKLPRVLRGAYFAMHRASDSHFMRHGITADQFVLIACLGEQDAVMQQDLVRRASSDPSTVRAMLVLLEGRGLVARTRHPEDGRAQQVRLTAKGRRLYQRLWRTSEPIRVRLLAGFSEQEADALLGLLTRLTQNAAALDGRRRPSKRLPVATAETV